MWKALLETLLALISKAAPVFGGWLLEYLRQDRNRYKSAAASAGEKTAAMQDTLRDRSYVDGLSGDELQRVARERSAKVKRRMGKLR